ncbi:hypothetical protein BZA70DRAFT_107335 [Myxozyma melibiosi]|uniref:PAS domain-containing protein n=1 Tax=Myxozyma melibiosi TaxID=54550 RepID=A0ABR1F9Q8_9ASCO
MDITFITIHDLTRDCRVLFASDSLGLVLGYESEDVRRRSVFDFVHPDELLECRRSHRKIVFTDKAAAVVYLRLLHSNGSWVSCECVLTVVSDVLFAATSVYQWTVKSEDRARLAPLIHRAFANSSASATASRARMLTQLAPKFDQPFVERERRAALILNRASLSLPVMYATHSIESLLGIAADDLKGWNFWDCVNAESQVSAQMAVERAKENDSIAYMRFLWCDPRSHAQPSTVWDSRLCTNMRSPISNERVEVEAVVSCSSDGLVVVLRRATPVTTPEQAMLVGSSSSSSSSTTSSTNPSLYGDDGGGQLLSGVFKSPWGVHVHLPPPVPTTPLIPTEPLGDNSQLSSLLKENSSSMPSENMTGGWDEDDDKIMESIQDLAVIAWGIRPAQTQHADTQPTRLP